MSDSTELEVPDEEPWMSHAFISKLATQVSFPYRRPKDGSRDITRRNGNLEVRFVSGGDAIPYGKYPRLFELFTASMVQTGAECFDPETNTLHLGTTFREFLKMLNIQVGGRQLKTIKPQLENLFTCTYVIRNNTETTSRGVSFVVAEKYNIDWLRNEPQEHGLFENWVQFSKGYVDKLRDSPVPVSLEAISHLTSPMSLDVYWWLARRYSYLRDSTSIKWEQLQAQFGSDSSLKKFKQNFKRAVADVLVVYSQARIICGNHCVTLLPSETSVPTKYAKRVEEKSEASRQHSKGEVSEADINEVIMSLGFVPEDMISVRKDILVLLTEGRCIDAVAGIIREKYQE